MEGLPVSGFKTDAKSREQLREPAGKIWAFKTRFQLKKIMAYIYLLDIYELIDQRVADAQAAMKNESGDQNEQKYQQGRIKALTDFQGYLTTQFNPKLPRRIRQFLKTKS